MNEELIKSIAARRRSAIAQMEHPRISFDLSEINQILDALRHQSEPWSGDTVTPALEAYKEKIAELERQRDAALAALGIVAKEIGAEPSLERLSDVIAAHMQHIRDMEAK